MLWNSLLLLLCSFIQSIAVDNFTDFQHGLRHSRKNSNQTKQETALIPGQNCEENFSLHIHKCMDPFSRNVHLYTNTHLKNPTISRIFVKHVCRMYKKMLLCIHTVLSNCQTSSTTHYVQNRLSKTWVSKTNSMCNIHLNSLKHHSNKGDNLRATSNHKSSSFPTSIFDRTDSNAHQLHSQGGDVALSMDGTDNMDKLHHTISQTEPTQITIPTETGAASKFSKGTTWKLNKFSDLFRSYPPQIITILQYKQLANAEVQKPASVAEKTVIMNDLNAKTLNSLLGKHGKNSVFLQLLLISVDKNNDLALDSDNTVNTNMNSRTANQISAANCSYQEYNMITMWCISIIFTFISAQ